jgi:hypothetical protein
MSMEPHPKPEIYSRITSITLKNGPVCHDAVDRPFLALGSTIQLALPSLRRWPRLYYTLLNYASFRALCRVHR